MRRFFNILNDFKNLFDKNHKLFTLWISDNKKLPELQHASLKSMLLTDHEVILFAYEDLDNVPEGIKIEDANDILDESHIFVYKEGFNKGSYSGFANWFRAKCLYEKGMAWFDCDIFAIKNINEFINQGSLISAQCNPDGDIVPNNAFLRLKKGDPLLKFMLNYMAEVKDNVSHGDTGPNLLKSSMENEFSNYFKFLSSQDFIASINYFDYMEFLKPSSEIVPNLNFTEIWGFHIWNSLFREDGFPNERSTGGFYHDLKEAILTSSTQEEYMEKISNIIKI